MNENGLCGLMYLNARSAGSGTFEGLRGVALLMDLSLGVNFEVSKLVPSPEFLILLPTDLDVEPSAASLAS